LEGNRELQEFKELYKSMTPILVFYAGKYVDMTTAEDLVQDVFLRVWQKRTPLLLKEGLKTYLYRSVQHACLDYLKHQDVEGDYVRTTINRLKIEEINQYNDIESLFEEDERLMRIYEEIEKLPEKCKEIFVMSYLEERKTGDIALLMNVSKRTVEAQLYKALKNLRDTLKIRKGKE
jgi:RNA polymerase sigma-70 factor (ECF subfamily)